MQSSAIGSSGGSTPVTSLTPTSQGLDALKSTDFFRLLIQELQSQDPLKPNDTNELVQQMSSIRQMEMSSTLNNTLNAFAAQQRIGEASGLIGRYVTGSVQSGDGTGNGETAQVQGVVVGVHFNSTGDAVLELHTGKMLPVKSVTSVQLVDPTTLQPVTPGTTNPAGSARPSAGQSDPGLTANGTANGAGTPNTTPEASPA